MPPGGLPVQAAPRTGVGAAAPSVAVRIERPRAALQPYVTFFYAVEAVGPLTDFLYPEWGNVRFGLEGDWQVRLPRRADPTPQSGALFGPTDRHGRIETGGGRCMGFGLTPIGWHRLVGEPAWLLANHVRPLGGLLGADPHALCAAMAEERDEVAFARLQALIAARLADAPLPDATMLAVDAALRTRPVTVGAFADAARLTDGQLRRISLALFGFPPKRVLRLQRFLGVLGHVRSAVGEPIETSLDDGYFDPPHFYRDFRDFMAMSPRDYFRAPRRLMAEAAAAQVRAGVTLSFDLPPPPE